MQIHLLFQCVRGAYEIVQLIVPRRVREFVRAAPLRGSYTRTVEPTNGRA